MVHVIIVVEVIVTGCEIELSWIVCVWICEVGIICIGRVVGVVVLGVLSLVLLLLLIVVLALVLLIVGLSLLLVLLLIVVLSLLLQVPKDSLHGVEHGGEVDVWCTGMYDHGVHRPNLIGLHSTYLPAT